MLKYLYAYATICFVGGAFGGDGVHNVLEAAVYNKPVVFGPVYEKYAEAVELIEAKGAVSIQNALELETVLKNFLADENLCKEGGAHAGNYVKSKAALHNRLLHTFRKNVFSLFDQKVLRFHCHHSNRF